MRRILITGATGFIGGHIARALAKRTDVKVRALCRNPSSEPARALTRAGVECVPGDLHLPETLEAACADVDAVVHAATDTTLKDPAAARVVGVDGTVALFDAACRSGARTFVFISSMAVYGGIEDTPREELSPKPFGDLYADLKIEAEEYLRAASSNAANMRTVILRLPSVYGPGSTHWTEEPLARAKAGKLVVPGQGAFAFPYLYVDNMVDAVLSALDRDVRGTFDVFDGAVTYREFMGHYAGLAGKPLKRVSLRMLKMVAVGGWVRQQLTGRYSSLSFDAVRRMSKAMSPNPEFSAKKAREELGWSPKVSLEEGMKRIAGTDSR